MFEMRCVLPYHAFDDVYSSDRFNMEVLPGPFSVSHMGPGNEAKCDHTSELPMTIALIHRDCMTFLLVTHTHTFIVYGVTITAWLQL